MRDPLRRAAGGLAVLLAGLLTLAPATPAAAATPRTAPPVPIGGPELGSHGVVVHLAPGVPPLPTGLTSHAWLVADLDTGQVLAAKNPHGRYLPASTLKTLTAVTLIPRLDPDAIVQPTYDDIAVDGSKVGLVDSIGYPVSMLFTAMLVVSGNDAANTLATAAGGTQKTLAMMNATARHLQALDTHAGTPSGLDAPGESTSAYDLALIAKAGLGMPAFRHYVGVVHSQVKAPHGKHFAIYTHDHLLTNYTGAIGVKNGYTVAAGATFVGAATRNGHTLVATCLHGHPNVWHEAAKLLDWGFAADGHVTPVGHLVDPKPAVTATTVGDHATTTTASGATHVSAVAHGDTGHHQTLQWVAELLVSAVAALLVSSLARRRRRRAGRGPRPRW